MRKIDTNKRLKEIYKIIGENIHNKRAKMTQNELAKKAKVSRGTISAIEDGNGINLETLIKIADALNVKPADLFISDAEKGEVSYLHVVLLKKLSESFNLLAGEKK